MPNNEAITTNNSNHQEDLELGESFKSDNDSDGDPPILSLMTDQISDSLEPTLNNNHQEDLLNQKLGPCFYFTIIPMVSLLLIPLFFSPAISLLLLIGGLLPCIILFLIIYFMFRNKIDLELCFHVLWSGVLSIIPIFLLEVIASILIISIMHGLNIITLDFSSSTPLIASIETQLENLSFVWKLVLGLVQSFLVSSLVEEVAKALLALKLTSSSGGGSFFSRCFKLVDNRTDKLFYHSHCHPLPPMIYSALAALGLSTVENIGFILVVCLKIYIVTAGSSSTSVILQFGGMTVVGRILLALPLHTLSGCLVGLRIAQYKIRLETQHLTEVPIFIESKYQDRQSNSTSTLRKIWINISFFCYVIYQPLVFHGLYDFILVIDLHFLFSLVLCVVIIVTLFMVVFMSYKTLVTQSRDLHALEISQIITQSDDEDGSEDDENFFNSRTN